MNPDPLLPFGILDTNWDHFALTNGEDKLELIEDRLNTPFIEFLNAQIGGFQGKTILELGPYEGYHTCNLENLGALEILAIEGNPRNFLKCLIVKNYYQLNATRFLLGDFTKYLQRAQERYDFILAAGVLYHSASPILLLRQITSKSDAIGISTTLYDRNNLVFEMTGRVREIVHEGADPFVLYERTNPNHRTVNAKFGLESSAWLMSKEDLFRYLEFRNFEIKVFEKGPAHGGESAKVQLCAVKRQTK